MRFNAARGVTWAVALALLSACGGGSSSSSAVPACDQACMDATALRSLRETLKLVYNLTLQGKPVGAQDATTPCPLGGSAHVFGQATSNAVQGATDVQLTYVLMQCAYLVKDFDPGSTYNMTLTGTVQETGTLSVQPTSTTAIELSSDSVTLTGTVYDPPINYAATACPLQIGQSGNQLSGTLCGRQIGLTL